MSRKSFQKIVTIVSIISLFGSTAYGAIALFKAEIPSSKLDSLVKSE
jgi:hypothetical protein